MPQTDPEDGDPLQKGAYRGNSLRDVERVSWAVGDDYPCRPQPQDLLRGPRVGHRDDAHPALAKLTRYAPLGPQVNEDDDPARRIARLLHLFGRNRCDVCLSRKAG